MKVDQKYRILEGIAGCVPENGAGEDEDNLLQNFLPLRSYSKLADSRTFLITGGRGTGKTELFRILTSYDGLSHILNEQDRRRYTGLQQSEFLVAYIAAGNYAKQFPIAQICADLLKTESSEELAAFWGGLACSVILRRFSDDEELSSLAKDYFPSDLIEVLTRKSNELSKWWGFAKKEKERWESFLDRVDEILHQRQIQIYLTYDELDKICSIYDDLFAYIRSLLSFWYTHNNRYTNIKAKIFLRTDLYNAKALQFVDSSKMRAYQLELQWDTLSLYRMLTKRMANTDTDEIVCYLNSIPGLLLPETKKDLGYLPGDSEEAFQLLIEKMIGKYMGKTPKRGLSYAWVPNHIQDANGEGAPRSFLRCFAFAAAEMMNHVDEIKMLEEDRLLSPAMLQGALAKVSADRVKELTQEEYQWLENLIERLAGKAMLMEETEFLSYLSPSCLPMEEREKLPGKTSNDILNVLAMLGIVMKTSDGRINVPEIYLHGFGLKRKGGIKRPKGKPAY